MTAELDQLSREELVRRARELGAERPEVMTRVELRDEIVRLSEPDPTARRRSRGWLGVARDLVASVVDAGLKMPSAASAIRGDARPAEETAGPPPVATLTLAEIYLAQGHEDRALAVLEEVLSVEPEHAAALALRDRIRDERASGAARRRVPLEPDARELDEPLSSPPAPAPFLSSAPPDAMREPYGSPVVPAAPQTEAEPELAPVVPNAAPAFDLTTEAAQVEREAPLFAPEPEPHVSAAPAPAFEPHVPPAFAPEAPGPPTFGPEFQTEPGVLPVQVAAPRFDSTPPPSTPTLAAPSPRTAAAQGALCVLVQTGTEVVAEYRLPRAAHGVILRVAWFVPGRRGPTEGSIDVPLERGEERVVLPPIEAGAHVRGALGIDLEGAFKPLAVAWVYRVSERGVSIAFAAPGEPPVALREQLGRGVADLLV